MSDRGFLFLFSVLMIAVSLGSAAYLVATGQAGTVDGLFLVVTALLIALCFVTLRRVHDPPRDGSGQTRAADGEGRRSDFRR